MRPRPHRRTGTPAPRGRKPLAAAVMVGAVFAIIAACHDNVGPGACFEPNAIGYPFWNEQADSTFSFRWPASYMPVRVYAESTGELVANATAGMTLWIGAFRCGELSLALTADSTHADIIVRNPQSLPAAGLADIVMAADSVGACTGVTLFDTTGTALNGPMRSYVSPRATDSVAVANCYHFVTAHELGHALGLLHHSLDTADLMYSSPRHRTLSAADRYTIQVLYHTNPTIGPPPR